MTPSSSRWCSPRVLTGVEGEGMPGVSQGIDFLRSITMGEKLTVGKQVAVIGGETQRSTAPGLQREWAQVMSRSSIVDRAQKNAGTPEDVDAVATKDQARTPGRTQASRCQDGRLSGIECLRMQLGTPDESGRARLSSCRV